MHSKRKINSEIEVDPHAAVAARGGGKVAAAKVLSEGTAVTRRSQSRSVPDVVRETLSKK